MAIELIQLAIYIGMFMLAALGIVWGVNKFQMPKWALWFSGALWLIILLTFLANRMAGAGYHGLHLWPR